MSDTPTQVFVRNEQGKHMGPIDVTTLGMVLGTGPYRGKLLVSVDGVNFVWPGMVPGVRDVFPKEMWGEGELPPPRMSPPGAPPAPRASAPVPHAPVFGEVPETLPTEGELKAVSPISLYYLAAATDATGRFVFTLADRTVEVHVKKGAPQIVESTHREDSLETFLEKNLLASRDQIQKADTERARFGGDLLPALFALGVLNPSSALPAIMQRLGGILLRVLAAEQGKFTFTPGEPPPGKSMPLGHKWGVLLEQIRKLPAAEFRRRLANEMDLPIMKGTSKIQASDLKLTPQEARAYSHFDGVKSLAQLCAGMPGDADHIVRTAYVCYCVELASFAAVRASPPESPTAAAIPAPVVSPPAAPAVPSTSPAPSPAAAKPTVTPAAPPKLVVTPAGPPKPAPPVAPASSPQGAAPAAGVTPAKPLPPKPPVAPTPAAGSASVPAAGPGTIAGSAEELKELRAAWEAQKTQNHFELLGVAMDAQAAQVKVAYFKLAKKYHPDTLPPNASAELTKLKEDLFGRVGEANRVLSDDKLRAEYLEEVKSGTVGEKVDVAMIFAAEEMFQKGMILVKARKFPEAVKMLEDAIKANPEEPEFYAWRGYAKFFTFADKKQGYPDATKDIQACLKKNDKISTAYYFLGHMAKLLGDNFGAKKHFQKCIELAPEHLDAQRELRLMK